MIYNKKTIYIHTYFKEICTIIWFCAIGAIKNLYSNIIYYYYISSPSPSVIGIIFEM